jgi:hypothetical protein
VLGVCLIGKGFRDEQTFPSVLSSIIKVAHFIVVLRAEQLIGYYKDVVGRGSEQYLLGGLSTIA